jgi:hypothetical protein
MKTRYHHRRTAKRKSLPIRLLGKIMFPRQAPWQQAANVYAIFCSVTVGIVTGGALVLFMLLHSSAMGQ